MSQLQAATGAACAAVVVAFAELVGVLEAVGAAAPGKRARLVLAAEDRLVDAQRLQDGRPVTMRAGLDVPDARFEIVVHDVLDSSSCGRRASPGDGCSSPTRGSSRRGLSRSCRGGCSWRNAGIRRPCAARSRRIRGTSSRFRAQAPHRCAAPTARRRERVRLSTPRATVQRRTHWNLVAQAVEEAAPREDLLQRVADRRDLGIVEARRLRTVLPCSPCRNEPVPCPRPLRTCWPAPSGSNPRIARPSTAGACSTRSIAGPRRAVPPERRTRPAARCTTSRPLTVPRHAHEVHGQVDRLLAFRGPVLDLGRHAFELAAGAAGELLAQRVVFAAAGVDDGEPVSSDSTEPVTSFGR